MPTAVEGNLTELSTLLSKRAENLFCCDSMFKAEEDRVAGVSSVRVSFDEATGDAKNPLSVVNVAKNILE